MANSPRNLKCFLSYRRDDSLVVGTVGRIHDRWEDRFGRGTAFMDVDDIPPTVDFREFLDESVSRADVLFVVMGPQWAQLMRERGKDDPTDFVRIEIESALTRGLQVGALLIGNHTNMPAASDLPDSLHPLLYRNAARIDPQRDFNTHAARLIADMERHFGGVSPEPKPQGAATILSPPEPEPEPKPKPVSKEHPLTNSLGMNFVPVPGLDGVLFSVWQTRVQDYAAFAAENPGIDMSWRDSEHKGHKQGPDHPVVKVSWEDANAFCEWLSRKEGKTYRLPTDHEWSVAVGIGDREDANASPAEKSGELGKIYPWGTQWPPLENTCNWNDEKKRAGKAAVFARFFARRFAFTAPVGSFALDHHGIKDLSGNVWEWCQDWYDNDHEHRVLRGGSWANGYEIRLQSSYRSRGAPAYRNNHFGFRCVLEVG